ncbi:mevalonate kinase [Thiomicrorhabdus hydrogeniphila]
MNTAMHTLCSVPAKIILSGEHAVIYNSSALSMAIKLYTQCDCLFETSTTNSVTVELVDYHQKHSFPRFVWQNLATNIETRFTLFNKHNAAIQSVLVQPIDLVLDTLYHFDHFHTMKPGNWHFKIESQVPIGKGLGSSAGVIVSILTSLFSHHQIEFNKDILLALARKVEARQHGKSSGIDPATMLFGGLLEFNQNKTTQKLNTQKFKAWLIDTGSPSSTTGQTVNQVKNQYANDLSLWTQFAGITQNIIEAWSHQDSAALYQYIEQNQILLEHIGVVPKHVQNFIQRLKTEFNATAKVCGAGSIKGDKAGVLICFSEQAPSELCSEFGYQLQPITIDNQGVVCKII